NQKAATMHSVPSSKNRRRVEIPAGLYDRLKEAAAAEGRTVTSVAVELLGLGLRRYKPAWVTSTRRDNFTPRAERVLELARASAPRRFHHNYIGTEHLLLALAGEREGFAARALRSFGATADEIARGIELIIGLGPSMEPVVQGKEHARQGGGAREAAFEGTLMETPRFKVVVGLAAGEAEKLDHAFVGTGHLLLGLIREGEGIAVGILDSLGVDMLALREAVLESFARGEMPLAET
ncbi:MAG TPA: Clp protease N-terminal domain-containing protein, partial [Chloroflexota bacterium]